MTRINPIDLSFLLLERANRPNHMAAYTIFEKPKGQKSSFGPRLFDAYRHSQAAKPFNHKLKWLGTDVAAWETVEPDMGYHIRHLALPAPGSMQQFHETVSFLNTGLLDRGHPMWECYIIDGIERGRIAILLKVHHALIDGEGGLRAMRNFLSDSGQGADAALILVGTVDDEVVSAATAVIGKGGTVVITGLADPAKLTVHVSGTDLTLHEKTIKGSLFGSCNPQYDIVRLLRLYDAGQLMLDELVTTTYNLEQVNQGYQDLRDGKNIRGVIVH